VLARHDTANLSCPAVSCQIVWCLTVSLCRVVLGGGPVGHLYAKCRSESWRCLSSRRQMSANLDTGAGAVRLAGVSW
jgi:hypothetical protein